MCEARQARKAKLMFLSNFSIKVSNCIVLESKVNKFNFRAGKLCKAFLWHGFVSQKTASHKSN